MVRRALIQSVVMSPGGDPRVNTTAVFVDKMGLALAGCAVFDRPFQCSGQARGGTGARCRALRKR